MRTSRFEKFNHRNEIHSVAMDGDAFTSKNLAAEKYVGELRDLENARGYLPKQVLNWNETNLFWKKMLNWTYITNEEKSMPVHKPMKDRITILVCTNDNGDCKIKPMVIYHSENPRIFERNKLMKSNLPVMWQSNHKTLSSRQFL